MDSSFVSRASVLRFGVFELDCRAGELRKSGVLLHLPPQPFKILAMLASQPGQVVTREEIRQQIWGDETFVDFERGLNQCVSQIRTALGDDADTPRFIETLPRRGYRFIGPVERPAPSSIPPRREESAGGGEGAALPGRRVFIAGAGALLVMAVVAMAAWWFGTRTVAPAPGWSGDLLPGPTIALFPRVSPDGHLIAFEALVDNLTQVAVMDPGSGNWRVLTHDRSRGVVIGLCWSRDGSRIYFDRFNPQPAGVYSVPVLGGEERLVVGDSGIPEALPDGSLLVVRVDSERKTQIYHFWPDTGRLQALGAWVELKPPVAIRVFPDGKEAVFFGTVKGAGSGSSPHSYVLDIAAGSAQRLAPRLSIVQSPQTFPVAITPDGQSVLFDLPFGNLHRIAAIPRSGAGFVRTLTTLTSESWSVDAAPDGSLYIDQVDQPLQVLRFAKSGGTPKVLASVESYIALWEAAPVEFPDGRVLVPTLMSGRPRLLMGKPGESLIPLLATDEETAPPMAQVGTDEVALMVGSPSARALAIASVKEGRIVRRFEATEGKGIDAVAASPDGKSIYYVSSGTVWSVPSQGGNARKICVGDGVAVDPNGRELIVNLNEEEHVRLERIPVSGGPARPIPIRSDLHINAIPVGPNALNKDGKLLVSVTARDSWFQGLAILDITTGKLMRVLLNYLGDIENPGWTSDGGILATAYPARARIWRFRPAR